MVIWLATMNHFWKSTLTVFKWTLKMSRKRMMMKKYVVTVCVFFFPYLHDHFICAWNRVIYLAIRVWLVHVLGCKFRLLELHLTIFFVFFVRLIHVLLSFFSLLSCSSALRLLNFTSNPSLLSFSWSKSNVSWFLEPNERRPFFSHFTHFFFEIFLYFAKMIGSNCGTFFWHL